jgi:hypothetical protein
MDDRPRHLRLVVDNGVTPRGQRRRSRFTHADRIERAALLRRVCAEYESWDSLSHALEVVVSSTVNLAIRRRGEIA